MNKKITWIIGLILIAAAIAAIVYSGVIPSEFSANSTRLKPRSSEKGGGDTGGESSSSLTTCGLIMGICGGYCPPGSTCQAPYGGCACVITESSSGTGCTSDAECAETFEERTKCHEGTCAYPCNNESECNIILPGCSEDGICVECTGPEHCAPWEPNCILNECMGEVL